MTFPRRRPRATPAFSPPSAVASLLLALSRSPSSAASRRSPYLASLRREGEPVCSGSLITKFAVLTSARCAGRFDAVTVGGETFDSFRTAVHPSFDSTTFDNDFLVVLLPRAVDDAGDGSAATVELNRFDVVPQEFALLSSIEDEGVETATNLAYVPSDECRGYSGFYPSESDPEVLVQESYSDRIKDSMLCALEEEEDYFLTDPGSECTHDVGAPLIVEGGVYSSFLPHDLLFGMVSWGHCNDRGFPGVFARVQSASKWIEEVVCGHSLLVGGPQLVPHSFSCGSAAAGVRATDGAESAASGGAAEAEIGKTEVHENMAPRRSQLKAQMRSQLPQTRQYRPRQSQQTMQWIQPDRTTQQTMQWIRPRPQTRQEWPHFLVLEITFDANPSEVSWKFQNRKTSTDLSGAAFGAYDAARAGETAEFRLDILTNEDLDGDPLVQGMKRNYRFVMFDRGGNGLCCDHGSGKYELLSKGTVVASGATYGAIDETFFEIDPQIYLGANANAAPSGPVASFPVAPIPAPTVPIAPQPTPPVPQPQPTPGQPGMPTLMLSFYCGTSYDDAEAECHQACPSGSPAQCDVPEHGCWASTTCYGRTRSPSASPTPLGLEQILFPTLNTAPSPGAEPANDGVPSNQQAIDYSTWFCGYDWEWIENNCDKAVPCPRGDPVDCPVDMTCFSSTPCTMSPTQSPTSSPTATPTSGPTMSPTKSPISEAAFLEFLNAEEDVTPVPIDNGKDEAQALEVNNALQNFSELQYNFFCGTSWTNADNTCKVFCPLGDKNDCPEGEECYANTRCDGRDTAAPSTSPAPNAQGAASSVDIVEEQSCTLCGEGLRLNTGYSVAFQTQTTTCGNVEDMLLSSNILSGSGTCESVRGRYREECCYDGCQLCQAPNGDILDLEEDHVVRKGGYEASCQDISDILISTAKDDTVCVEAQSQLGGDCCYEQCSLCGGEENMSTEWYATVTFQGLTTTCLGLDYYIRAERIDMADAPCTVFQETYKERCCFATDSCRLCKVDETLYELDASRTVTVQQSSTPSTTTTCAAVSASMEQLEEDDQFCTEGKQAYFGKCCNLQSVVNDGSPLIEDSDSNMSPRPGVPGPSPWVPQNNLGADAVSTGPTSSSAPSPEGGVVTTSRPTTSFYWEEPSTPLDAWDRQWNPPNSGYGLGSLISLSLSACISSFILLFM
ncbi:hypothetical protein ACHAWF_012888 [Thalassiosira exigua]